MSHSGCSSVSDENWDEDQLLGFEPCNENLVSGCNIIGGRCECDAVRACSSPFEFPRKDACLAALKRIEGKWRAPGSRGATHTGCGGHALSMSGCWYVGVRAWVHTYRFVLGNWGAEVTSAEGMVL